MVDSNSLNFAKRYVSKPSLDWQSTQFHQIRTKVSKSGFARSLFQKASLHLAFYQSSKSRFLLIGNTSMRSRQQINKSLIPKGRSVVGCVVVLLLSGLTFGSLAGANDGNADDKSLDRRQFVAGPGMNFARREHTIIPLQNADVLVLGGYPALSAGKVLHPEIYSLQSNKFILAKGHNRGAANFSPEGNISINGYPISPTVEPSNLGKFFIDYSKFHPPRFSARILLPDRRVLVAGGDIVPENDWVPQCPAPSSKQAFLYDIRTKTAREVSNLIEPRSGFSATKLNDGRIFFVGGQRTDELKGQLQSKILDSTEFYNPKTKRFLQGPRMKRPRVYHTAVCLKDGRLLVLGGEARLGDEGISTAEIYDPVSNKFTLVSPMSVARRGAIASLLPGGKVLVTGGNRSISKAEIFDPNRNTFSNAGNMTVPRMEHAIATLANHAILITGGIHLQRNGSDSLCEILNSTELVFPAQTVLPVSSKVSVGHRFGTGHAHQTDFIAGGAHA